MAKTKIHGEYLDPSVISTQTEVTAVGSDHMLIFDATDNALKKALLSDLIETVGSTPTFSQISSTGNLTIDAAGDIILDADGDDWKFHEGGNAVFEIKHESHGVDFLLNTTDEDWRFKGSDGGSTITALHLDMSERGNATFYGNVLAYGNSDTVAALEIYSDSNHGMRILHRATDGDFSFERRVGGTNTEFLRIGRSTGNFGIGASSALDNKLEVNGGDIRVRGTSTPSIKFNNGNQEVVGMRLQSGAAGVLSLHTNKVSIDSYGGLNLNGEGAADGYAVPQDQSLGYTNNLNAGAFGILHRSGYDCYVTGNAYYYKTGGSAGWKSKYPTYKSTIMSMLDGRFVFDTTSSAPGGSGVVALPSLVTAVRIDSDGLKFGTDTAAANALDDYEEGTWTPAIGGSSGNPTVSYAQQDGKYIKIGRMVKLFGKIRPSSVSGGSGGLQITGLPFTAHNDSDETGGSIGLALGFSAVPNNLQVDNGNQVIYVLSAAANNLITDFDFSYLYFQIDYLT